MIAFLRDLIAILVIGGLYIYICEKFILPINGKRK